MDKLRAVLRSLLIYGKMDLYWFLRDTQYCCIQITASMLTICSTYMILLFLAKFFNGLGNFTYEQVMLCFGYGALTQGYDGIFFADHNNGAVSRVISRGQLDHYYLQPQPMWIQVLTRGFCPKSNLLAWLFGLSLLSFAMVQLNLFSWGNLFVLSLMSFCSLLIVTSCTYICSCLAFYAPAAAEELSIPVIDMFWECGNLPLGNMSFFARILCSTIIPVGIVAWLPIVLFLHYGHGAILFMFSITIIFVGTAVLCFRKGLVVYGERGASRYSSFGHR